MRILITLFKIQDFGGICADIELMARGLMEHGHEVKMVLLNPGDRDKYINKPQNPEGPTGSYPSVFPGVVANTRTGWYNIPVMTYGSEERLKKWRKVTDKFDLVIHEIPGPNPNGTTKAGNISDKDGYWKKLYDIGTPQIVVAHDAHFRDMYPHIIQIADKIKGIACTNHAGYVALSWMPCPRAFIGAAHQLLDWETLPEWDERKPRAVCAHVWKAWKHMDYGVRAAPYLKRSSLVMAGDGIERHYMTSTDKFKDKYEGIWQKALDAGMVFEGLIPPKRLFKIYQKSRTMLDMSWSEKYRALSNHFNRAIIEGYNNGCVPICTDVNMQENNPQIKMFQAGKTHIEVPHDVSPKKLAAVMDEVANMDAKEAAVYIKNGRKVLSRFFDYKKTSLEFIKLSQGKPAGVYPMLETGKLNPQILANCNKFLGIADQPVKKTKSLFGKP